MNELATYTKAIERINLEIANAKNLLDEKDNADIWYELNEYLHFLESDKTFYNNLIGEEK
jgi:hypothetical protein